MITSKHPQIVSIDKSSLGKAKKAISVAQNILIMPHANVDPDGLGAALASYLMFSSLGKKCTVYCPETLPESLTFLPGFDKLEGKIDVAQDFIVTIDCSSGVEIDKLRYTIEEKSEESDKSQVNIIVTPRTGKLTTKDASFKEGPLPYDLIVVVDSAELKLLGSVYENHKDIFEKVPVLNIDHHVSNPGFGTTQLISTEAASATEVLYEWFVNDEELKSKITPDIATLLLAGLITDTRSFQNPNTTPRSMEIAAELLEIGARQQEIIRFIYKTKPLSTLKIWGRALNNIQINPKEKIVWSSVSREDLDEMGATSKETHGVIDDLLTTVPDSDIYIMFTEEEKGSFKASMRTSDAADASKITSQLFGGGGHARAAGFKRKDYDNFQLEVLECVRRIIGDRSGSDGISDGDAKETKETKETKDNENDGAIDVIEKLNE